MSQPQQPQQPHHAASSDSLALALSSGDAATPFATAEPAVLTALIEQVDAAWERDDAVSAIRLLTVALWPLFLDRPAELARLLERVPEHAAPSALLLAKRFALPVLETPERIRLLATRQLDANTPVMSGADLGWHIAQRMLAHRLRGEFAEAREVGQRLRHYLEVEAVHEPAHLPQFTAAAFAQLGTTELLAGDPGAAAIEYRRAAAATDSDADLGMRRDALVKLACVLAMEGRLRDAEATLARADTERQPNNSYTDRIHARTLLARALVAVERMDPEAPVLLEGLDREFLFEYWPLVLLAEGRWALAVGNAAGTLDLIDAATQGRPVPEGSLGLCITTFLREKANELLGLSTDREIDDPRTLPPLCALGAVRALMRRADPIVAVNAARALAQREGTGPSVRLEALLLTSWTLQRAGLPQDPRLTDAAAALAQHEGLWRPLTVVPEWLRETLPVTAPAHVGGAVVTPPPLAVALTPRQQEVLVALAGRESLGQIAVRFHVSVNTIKTQVRALYRRLGVNSRRDAISEATRRGLLVGRGPR